ncbi:hypothetical protein PHLCEN_2v5841 [Hermanssonia centrifuga]|uniref:OPT oligopeptide transporter n=1 Tax=Hermanssonia centrifuga TaxID=98765 RepID=A0A2R6P1K0_9APHY|nr:hypothetical protein PHLCEN_2v5841 [Hermanssonia centrifuga]
MATQALPSYEGKDVSDSVEKISLDSDDKVVDDAQMAKEVEAFEERLQNDDASDNEYRINEAYEVAIKVLSTRDEPELQSLTFRTFFLGLGFSAFGAVLAQIYYFKPQTLLVSTLFLLVISYWFGTVWHMALPSHGIFKWINPGPFNIKEHVAIIIMSSTAAGSATAIQVISVQDYDFEACQSLLDDFLIIPQWIFPLLTGVSIFCLANNKSTVFRNIFGGASNNEGMGLLSWSFDWNLIGSPCLYNPIWLQINQDIGIIFTYILMSAVYYGNLWNAKQFPFMSQAIFAQDGSQYNQTALLTNGRFDPVKYQELGPAFFSATNALYLITSNLSLGAVLTHVLLWHWDDLRPFFRSFNPWNRIPLQVHDPHFEKMKVYKQIPRWWFYIVLAVAYAIAQATNYTGHSGMPWWTLTVLVIISFIFCALYGMLAATIGFYEFSSSGTGFFQMITAYILPGQPVANMYGALYGQHPMIQGIALLQDLKLGQYVKLAPRVTFLMQMIGTVVGAVLNYIMMLSIINNNRDALLSISGTRLWSGQNAQGYNSNAISWGALGPEMFGPKGIYHMVPISLAIGVFLPFPFYIAHRIWPKAGFQNFNTSIIMQYSCFLSVGINTSVNPSMVLGILSQWWVRTRYPRWFTKYNYIVAAGLDGGTQVISFILNFAVFGASGTAHTFPTWWGNDINLSADRCVLPDN